MPKATQSESDYVLVPPGTHIATCFSMVSLGTQPSNNPKYAPRYQVVLVFELPNEKIDRGNGPEPMILSHFIGTNLGKRKVTKTREFLQAWRGREFTPQELAGFDLAKVVGAPAMLNVIHERRADGTEREKIASISPLMRGAPKPPQFHKSVVYEIEQKRDAVFALLPEWMQKKISLCEEWQPAVVRVPAPDDADMAAEAAEVAAAEAGHEPDVDDDVPF